MQQQRQARYRDPNAGIEMAPIPGQPGPQPPSPRPSYNSPEWTGNRGNLTANDYDTQRQSDLKNREFLEKLSKDQKGGKKLSPKEKEREKELKQTRDGKATRRKKEREERQKAEEKDKEEESKKGMMDKLKPVLYKTIGTTLAVGCFRNNPDLMNNLDGVIHGNFNNLTTPNLTDAASGTANSALDGKQFGEDLVVAVGILAALKLACYVAGKLELGEKARKVKDGVVDTVGEGLTNVKHKVEDGYDAVKEKIFGKNEPKNKKKKDEEIEMEEKSSYRSPSPNRS